VHSGLAWGPAAFLEVARRAGGGDIFPRRPPALRSRDDMVEREFPPNYLHDSWRDYLYWDVELEP
jgi:hypothetical protein